MKKEAYESWTVQDFVDELQMQADLIMIGQALHKPFRDRKEEKWCHEEQPMNEKLILEVVGYFAERYGLT